MASLQVRQNKNKKRVSWRDGNVLFIHVTCVLFCALLKFVTLKGIYIYIHILIFICVFNCILWRHSYLAGPEGFFFYFVTLNVAASCSGGNHFRLFAAISSLVF